MLQMPISVKNLQKTAFHAHFFAPRLKLAFSFHSHCGVAVKWTLFHGLMALRASARTSGGYPSALAAVMPHGGILRNILSSMAGASGLEPPTAGIKIRCFYQLSYTPAKSVIQKIPDEQHECKPKKPLHLKLHHQIFTQICHNFCSYRTLRLKDVPLICLGIRHP